eukprot:UN4198
MPQFPYPCACVSSVPLSRLRPARHDRIVNWQSGLVDCPALRAEYGCDAYLPGWSARSCKQGDMVDFVLRFSADGQPQAKHPRKPDGNFADFADRVLADECGLDAPGDVLIRSLIRYIEAAKQQ